MTAPISLNQPDQSDLDRTASLVKALEPHGCFEGELEMTHRMEVNLISHSIFYNIRLRNNLDSTNGLINYKHFFQSAQPLSLK